MILLILISGCKGKKGVEKIVEDIRTGTEGIVINFLPNNPPPIIHADQKKFDVVLELNNKGAFPQPDDSARTIGNIYLSGYDPNILKFDKKYFELKPIALEGKSIINLNGGSDIVVFKVKSIDNLNIEKYDLILLATVCYSYITTAAVSVCIDPDPYSTLSEKKVCEVKDITLSNQGAPIAVTKIEEEAFAQKTQFKITIKNVGGGDTFKTANFDKCNPFGKEKLGREDIDKVLVKEVKIADTLLKCRPFAEGDVTNTFGYIRLINGEGSIICELTKEGYESYKKSKTSFTTTLRIELIYNYRTTAERKIQIKKEMGDVDGGDTSEEPRTIKV